MLEEDIVYTIKAMDFFMEMQINLLEDEGICHTYILKNKKVFVYIHTYINTMHYAQWCTGLLFQQTLSDKNDPQFGNRASLSQHAVNLLENRRYIYVDLCFSVPFLQESYAFVFTYIYDYMYVYYVRILCIYVQNTYVVVGVVVVMTVVVVSYFSIYCTLWNGKN